MIALALVLLAVSSGSSPPDAIDLPTYRAALITMPDGPVLSASFRDLWANAETYRGRPIRVEGRVVRRFQADPSPEFPSRVELWITTPANNLFCLVTPGIRVSPDPFPVGSLVSFEGTSLGHVRYASGEGDRLAPLVVGPRPPGLVPSKAESVRGASAEWVMGGIAAGIVAMALARTALKRPALSHPETGPGVEFES